MRFTLSGRVAIKCVWAGVASLLVGCGQATYGALGNAPTSPLSQLTLNAGPPRHQTVRVRDGATVSTVYVAQYYQTAINAYGPEKRKNAGPECQINNVSYVNGIGVDRAGNLWVPTGMTINEYAANCGSAETVLSDPTGFPDDVAFDNKGDVVVSNFNYPAGSLNGELLFYAKGSTQPTRALTDPSVWRGVAAAVDAENNCYLSYESFSSSGIGRVIEFPKCKSPGKILSGVVQVFISGIEFDSKGHLLVVALDKLSIYSPPFTGQPITISLQGNSPFCALGAGESRLYCSDLQGKVDVYRYYASNPAQTSYLYNWNNGLSYNGRPTGVAVYPAPKN